MGLGGDLGSIIGKRQENKRNRALADRENKNRLALFNTLDQEPMYASQLVPQYKQTQSPVARAYLESMLMGANKDAVSPTGVNSALDQKMAVARKNALFGTDQELLQKQQALQSQPLYQNTAPTRRIVPTAEEKFARSNPAAAGVGASPELLDALKGKGKSGKWLARTLEDPEWNDISAKIGENGWKRLADAYALGDDAFQKAIDQQMSDPIRHYHASTKSPGNLTNEEFNKLIGMEKTKGSQRKARRGIGAVFGLGWQ